MHLSEITLLSYRVTLFLFRPNSTPAKTLEEYNKTNPIRQKQKLPHIVLNGWYCTKFW